jgi:hypothetical protein
VIQLRTVMWNTRYRTMSGTACGWLSGVRLDVRETCSRSRLRNDDLSERCHPGGNAAYMAGSLRGPLSLEQEPLIQVISSRLTRTVSGRSGGTST